MIDPKKIRAQFPFFSHHPGWVYLDNAATTQKPLSVIRGIQGFYEKQNTNIHRGIYRLATDTSEQYETVRSKVAEHIGTPTAKNIVFTSGTTAAINLVAQSYLEPKLKQGDNVILSAMEHHANLIPWQMLCKKKGAELRIIPMNERGELDLDIYQNLLSEKTRMVAVVHISNSLGTINPVRKITALAQQKKVPVLIDGAQSVAWHPLNVSDLGCDFFVFSGHKVFGPTGIGVLYGKTEHLEQMQPVTFGGDMIREVTFTKTTFADAPQRFEAGTTHIAGVIGLGHALDFVDSLDQKAVLAHLQSLRAYAKEQILSLKNIRIIGDAEDCSSILGFSMKNVHPHDVATFLGEAKIALRAGHHCTQPVMDFFGVPGTVRASFSIYNSREEINRLVEGLKEIQAFFL